MLDSSNFLKTNYFNEHVSIIVIGIIVVIIINSFQLDLKNNAKRKSIMINTNVIMEEM